MQTKCAMPVYCIKHRKLLMEYDMMRTDLRHATGMSLSAFTRFSRGDHMALVVIAIISHKLQCAEIKAQKTFWIEQHGNLENTKEVRS